MLRKIKPLIFVLLIVFVAALLIIRSHVNQTKYNNPDFQNYKRVYARCNSLHASQNVSDAFLYENWQEHHLIKC
jgi:hypothetical protein